MYQHQHSDSGDLGYQCGVGFHDSVATDCLRVECEADESDEEAGGVGDFCGGFIVCLPPSDSQAVIDHC